MGSRGWNGSASPELGRSPAAPPRANKRAQGAAGSGTAPAPSCPSAAPPAGTRQPEPPPKTRHVGTLPWFCLSVGSERRAGCEAEGLSWRTGGNPQNPITGTSKWAMLLCPPNTCSRWEFVPIPGHQGGAPKSIPSSIPSSLPGTAGALGRSLALPQLNSHSRIP